MDNFGVTVPNHNFLFFYLEEKPSYPYCAVHGDVATGHLVTLTCHSEKGSPSPTYTWTRLDQGVSKQVMGNTGVIQSLMLPFHCFSHTTEDQKSLILSKELRKGAEG